MNKQQLCFRFYQLIILLLTPVLILLLCVRSIRQKAYRQRMLERLGWISSKLQPGGIVVHAASVGEVIAVKPFVDKILTENPEQIITLTTFTPTGSAQVSKLFGDKVQHCYLPLDISFCVHLFLKILKPKAMVLMETELWPTLIHRCYKSEVKLLLINGRLSANSLRSYQKIISLIKPALNKFEHILCQSYDNAENFISLGAAADIVTTSGNLKYDISITERVREKITELEQIKPDNRTILVVGSSHQHEEPLLIDAFKKLKQAFPNLLLVLVPRHPERFVQVGKDCQTQGFHVARRSANEPITPETDIWLIDTLGELLAVYGLADVCIVAGSFSDVEGHNPLEPALFAKPILVGPRMGNFKEMNQKLLDAHGIYQLDSNGELIAGVERLLHSPSICESMGKAASGVVQSNQGATNMSYDYLKRLIDLN